MHVTLKYKAPKLPKKMGAFKPCDACIKALQNFFFLYSYLLPMLCKLKSGLSLRFLSCRVNTTRGEESNSQVPLLALKDNWFDTLTMKQWEIMIYNNVLLFSVTKRKHLTSSSYITGVSQGYLLVLFFFYFPMKVARDHIQSSWGKSPAPGT